MDIINNISKFADDTKIGGRADKKKRQPVTPKRSKQNNRLVKNMANEF